MAKQMIVKSPKALSPRHVGNIVAVVTKEERARMGTLSNGPSGFELRIDCVPSPAFQREMANAMIDTGCDYTITYGEVPTGSDMRDPQI